MRVLVTGARGYIGSRLVPELLARGHEVIATSSDGSSRTDDPWREQVQWRAMDVFDPEQVRAAVEGIDVLVYLIHGLDDRDYVSRDAIAAANVAQAVDDAGVGHVVYLSGLVPDLPDAELSDHLRSRLQVEDILTLSSATTLTLRAAIVMGSGSASFEVVRQVSRRMPGIRPVPTWMRDTLVQPIAVSDAVEYLALAVEATDVHGYLDIGGPDVLSYPELLRVYADVVGYTRVQIPLPWMPPELMGPVAGALTDVDDATVEALVHSLHHDMICRHDAREVLGEPGRTLVGVRESITRGVVPFDPAHDGAAAGEDPLRPSAGDPAWTR